MMHLKAIFAEGELDEKAVVKYFLTTALDGKDYQVGHYHIDAVLAVTTPSTSWSSGPTCLPAPRPPGPRAGSKKPQARSTTPPSFATPRASSRRARAWNEVSPRYQRVHRLPHPAIQEARGAPRGDRPD